MGSPTSLVFPVGYVQMYSWARTAGLQSVHLQSTWLLASCGRHCVNHCSSTAPQQSCPCSVNTVHRLLGRVCSAVFLAWPLGGGKGCPYNSPSPLPPPPHPAPSQLGSPSPPPILSLLALLFSFPSLSFPSSSLYVELKILP